MRLFDGDTTRVPASAAPAAPGALRDCARGPLAQHCAGPLTVTGGGDLS